MDPNLFHLDWERTGEVLAAVVLLSMLLERALSPFFESAWYIRRLQHKELKELIAFIVAATVCWSWKFDAVSMIVLAEKTNPFGYLMTGAIVAGGSKGSIRLFREALGFKSTARKRYEDEKKDATVTPLKPAAAGTGS